MIDPDMPIDTPEQRQAVFDALTDVELEYCFVMAVARDDERAGQRLLTDIEKRKAAGRWTK